MVKNPSVNSGDMRDSGLIPGLGSPLEEGMASHSSILAWRILWTDEPDGQWGHKESDMTEAS